MEVKYCNCTLNVEGENTPQGFSVNHKALTKLLDKMTESYIKIDYGFVEVTESYAAVTCTIWCKCTGRTVTEIGEGKGDKHCEKAFQTAFDKAVIRFFEMDVALSQQEKESFRPKKTEDDPQPSDKLSCGDYRPVFESFLEKGEDYGLSVSQFFIKAETDEAACKRLEDYISRNVSKEQDKNTKIALIAIQRHLVKGYILNTGIFTKNKEKVFTAQQIFEERESDNAINSAVQMYLSADPDKFKNQKDKICLFALHAQAEIEAASRLKNKVNKETGGDAANG